MAMSRLRCGVGRSCPCAEHYEKEPFCFVYTGETPVPPCKHGPLPGQGTVQTDPTETRTPVAGMKTRCPRPLDDGAEYRRPAGMGPAWSGYHTD